MKCFVSISSASELADVIFQNLTATLSHSFQKSLITFTLSTVSSFSFGAQHVDKVGLSFGEALRLSGGVWENTEKIKGSIPGLGKLDKSYIWPGGHTLNWEKCG
jgi:hypothetical protein